MYCPKCGMELKEVSIKEYDINTGIPIYNLKCPSGICEHYGCPHEWRGTKWSEEGDFVCDKCKKITWRW